MGASSAHKGGEELKDTCKYKLILEKEETYPQINLQKLTEVERFLTETIKLNKEPEEVIILIALDMDLNVVGFFEVSRGTINHSSVYAGDIFKRLFATNCMRFMIAHNHPSGNTKPSPDDDETAKKIREVSKLLKYEMVDFLIVGDNVLSYRKEKRM